MVHLLDPNVLIALGDHDHVHNVIARNWFAHRKDLEFATCPITQGALLRVMLQRGRMNVKDAAQILRGFIAHAMHQFWAGDLSYDEICWDGVIGHRQITDAYLAALARKHKGSLATFDRGLAIVHHDVAVLIPT